MNVKLPKFIIRMSKMMIYACVICYSLTMVLGSESIAQRKHLSEIEITIDQDNTDLMELIREIERDKGFGFSYTRNELKSKKINIKSGTWTMENLLSELSIQAGLSFKRINEDITVKVEDEGKVLPQIEESVTLQTTVSGSITDENGEPLPGATVLEKGTINGTTTDIDGKFKFNTSENAVLTISFVGYETLELPVNGRSVIDVQLSLDAEQLEEVVVVGYGTVKKTDLTGSVSQIEIDEVKDIPANSVEGILQGRAAGLQVINSSQDPGAGATVRIRGGSSLRGSNAPLVVVDGFPLGGAGDLKQINPADIESVEILKDASAAAIYGSRGANGVILITTRKAKTGRTTVNIRQQVTYSEFSSKLNLWRDPALMARLSNEAAINGGFPPQYIGAVNNIGIYYPSIAEIESGEWPHNTQWDDIVFRDRPISNNTTFSISGSNQTTNFNLSGNYYTDQGVFIDDDYSKVNVNLNVGHNFYETLKVTFASIINRGNRNDNGGLAYWRNPLLPIYNDDGTYYRYNNNDFFHPIAITENRLNTTKSFDALSFLDAEWEVFPWLTLTSRLNYKYGTSLQDQYDPPIYTQNGQNNNGAGYIRNGEWNTLVSETFVNYNKLFGNHEIGATAGWSYQNDLYRGSSLGAFDFVNSNLNNENIGSGNPEQNEVSNGYQETKLMSGIFRVNYVFNNKYLFTFTSRADGSSKFGANNKWAFFPSGAISWKAHEEPFINAAGIFDQLKFRASYGISGNQGLSPYETLSRFGLSEYYNNGNWITAIGPGREVGRTGQDGIEVLWGGIPNPDLRWETTAQYDLGVDMGFVQNRIKLIVDYYIKYTDDLIQSRILPVSSGYDRMLVNQGAITNKGFEVTVDAGIIQTDDLNFNATLIYSRNRNEVTDLGSVEQSGLSVDPNTGMQYQFYGNSIEMYRDNPNLLAIGQPVNVFYGYKTDGIVQTLEEGLEAGLDGEEADPGEYKYVDINDDGVIDNNDKTIIGDPNPDFTASINLSASYKKFDVSIFLNGVFGNDVINTQAFNQPNNRPFRWTPDNPTDEYPSLRDGRFTRFADWWIEDGSFVRIQNLNLGYTIDLPSNISARVFMNASNLFTFSKFEGYDPEVGLDGRYWGGIPRLRKWTLGLNLSF